MNMGRLESFGCPCVCFPVDSSYEGRKREWSFLRRGHFEMVGGTVGGFLCFLE